MIGGTHSNLAGDIAAAIAWWQDAGVDCAFSDEPRDWLPPAPVAARPATPAVRTAPLTAAPPPPSPDPIGGDSAAWPADLATWREWWLTAPELDDGRTLGRVAPRGNRGAALMVLVEQPEEHDDQHLLCGPQGMMLAAMIGAMGLDDSSVYVAALLPRHMPGADWASLGARGLGALTLHHISLVAPQRIVAFGTNIPPLLGHGPTQIGQILPVVNHEGRSIPMIAEGSLAALTRANGKAALWKRWLEWTRNDT